MGNTWLPFYLGLGGPIASGNQWFPWVSLGLRFSLEHRGRGRGRGAQMSLQIKKTTGLLYDL